MIRWLINSSMRLQFLVIVLAIVLMGVGISQLSAMPVDVFPEFNSPLVEVQTEALGLAAQEVEALVTTPLEADLLNGVAWLDRIYSESVAGLSSVLLIFEPGTDPIRARQMVQERLSHSYALPNVSKPPVMLQPLSTTSRMMAIGLSSSDVTLIDISLLAHWNIKPRLMGVPGVANVAIWGQRDWQLQVQVDPERLHAAGITLSQIIETTGNSLWASPLSYLRASTPGNAGWIDTPNQRLTIMHRLPNSRADGMAQVAITGEQNVVLGDVTNVLEDHQPLIGDAVVDEGTGLILILEKFPGANTLEVTRGVEAALEAMKPGLAGIEIDTTIFRPANYIEQATANLFAVLLISGIFVILVLFAFFFGWRSTIVSLVAIAVSLTAALLVLYLRGATFNMMVLAGLVIALIIIIDDAIVDVDHIVKRLRQHLEAKDGKPSASIILEAMLETRSPLLFAVLILTLAVLPVILLEGLPGAFFQPFAGSYVLAVFASMVAALIVTPALSVALLSNISFEDRTSPLAQAAQNVYNSLLGRFIHSPYAVIASAIVVTAIGAAALFSSHLSLVPSFRETDLVIQWEGAPGTSHTEMARLLTQVCGELRAISGVRNCGSHIGRAVTGDRVVGINSGQIWVSLDPAADYDTTLTEIRNIADEYPGFFAQVETYMPERIVDALTGPENDIVVRVYGNNFETLEEKAEEVGLLVSEVAGVVNTQVEHLINEPEVEIEVRLDDAERFQVSPGNVRRAATTLLSGLPVGNLYEEQKVFDVVVIGVPEIRNSLTDIENLLIDTPSGLVRLGDLADVRVGPSPVVIRRDAVSRFLDITADVSGRDIAAVMADITARLEQVEFPLEFRAEFLDDAILWQAASRRIQIIAVLSVVGIFFLFQAVFRSWNLATLAILTLPVSMAGGAVAIYLGDGKLSLNSMFGFLAIFGFSVRTTIVMINHLQRLQEKQTFGPQLILRGASERFIPTLLTALATGLALLPFILGGNQPGSEIVYPIAIVVVGGLVTGAVFNLFILPVLYLRFAPSILSTDPFSTHTDTDDVPEVKYA